MFFCVSTDGPNVSALIFAYTLKMGARCGIMPRDLLTQTSKHGYRGLLIHPHLSSDRCEPWRVAGQEPPSHFGRHRRSSACSAAW